MTDYKKIKTDLDSVSPSFCLAKWLQVTIHLQNGQTHSCHHPTTHKVPLKEIESNPSALHNTTHKKLQRKKMLEGERPKECEYCWKIEDSHPDNISDRIIKSSDPWSYEHLDEIKKLPWETNVNPKYLELSFGNECNFKCAYCAPHISSAIMTEYQQFGHYSTMPGFQLDVLKQEGLFPIHKDEHNPYVDAFWEWWPSIQNELKIFRITGGEPLINQNTYRFLDSLKAKPLPELSLGINSNLGIPDSFFQKFVSRIKEVISDKSIKNFTLYSSVDTYGKNAEFVRFGLNYESFLKNIETFLREVPDAEVNLMCTYNAFSVVNFDKFLVDIAAIKNKYRNASGGNRVHLDLPYLKDPVFLSCYVLTPEFKTYMQRDLEFIKKNSIGDTSGYKTFSDQEVSKMERIINWFNSIQETEHQKNSRRAFFVFITQYTKRKQIRFDDYCPEYLPFYEFCKNLHLGG